MKAFLVLMTAVLIASCSAVSAQAQDSDGSGATSASTAGTSVMPNATDSSPQDATTSPMQDTTGSTAADTTVSPMLDATGSPSPDAVSSAASPDGAAGGQPETVSTLNPDIASLEKRFFDHTYPNEPLDTRLDRLERMVFGEQKTGSDQARMTALLLAVPAEPAASSSQTASGSTNATGQSTAATGQTAQQTTPDSDQGDSGASEVASGDVGDYPRITQLEQEILGKTFQKEPIQNRLEQLELKAFGKADAKADLSDRTEKLEDYADKHFPQQQRNYADTAYDGYPPTTSQYPQPAENGYAPIAPNPNLLPPNSTLDQKVTWLEQQVFGATYPTQPLLDRVNRLAGTVFPTDSPQRAQSLADQVNSMIGAVELNPRRTGPAVAEAQPENQPPQYSPPPFSQYPQGQYAAQPDYSTQYNQPQGLAGTPTTQAPSQNHGHSFIHGLAHVLGTVGQLAAGQLAGSMMMGGMGGGGYGYGMPFGL
jgi:hypothetical protein